MLNTADAARAVREVVDGSAVLLDVRRDVEWESGHAAGAVHWPLARLQAGELPPVAEDAKVYTYCEAGGRAGVACDLLRTHGYTDVTNLGGLSDWRRAGGDIE